MKIGINASFVRKLNTGIGQVSLNFLQKLAQPTTHNPQPTTQFFLYLEKDIDLDLPKGFTKRIFLPLWKRDDLIRKIWWEKYLLPRKVKEDKCDAFLSLYQCPSIFTPPLNPPLKEEGRDKIRHIMIVHDIIPKLFPEYLNNSRKKLYWKLTEKAIKKADKIIAVSEHTKKDLIQHLNIAPEKISINYIDVDGIYKKEVSEDKSREVLKKYNLKSGYIYSGGGLEKRKNIDSLIRAYKLLLDRNKNAPRSTLHAPRLVISGRLMPELAPLITDVEKLVKDLGLQDKVKLLDFVPQEDLPALYKNASVFVYPSLYEGFGLPVLEAMNCGVPVICSQSSSLSEITNLSLSPFGGDLPAGEAGVRRGETNEDSKTFDNTKISKISQEPPSVPMGHLPPEGGEEEHAAVLFDPKNTKDIAEKIEKVLSDKKLKNELSAKGKEQAKKFSWDKFVEKVMGHFLQ